MAEEQAGEQGAVQAASKLGEVLGKIKEIVYKSGDGKYIYRGEPEDYGKVTSSLYRQYEEAIEAKQIDIQSVQEDILEEARNYTDETDDFTIQAELQHYGGKTNLIDFTTDYLIALFFACAGSPEKNGRVILQKREDPIEKWIKDPKIPKRRVLAQKSIFIEPSQGYLKPEQDKVISIPEGLKAAVLDYLQKHYGISTAAIYNDLHGFIKNQGIHQRAYKELYKGVAFFKSEEI